MCVSAWRLESYASYNVPLFVLLLLWHQMAHLSSFCAGGLVSSFSSLLLRLPPEQDALLPSSSSASWRLLWWMLG